MWKPVKLGDVCELQPKKAQVKQKLADDDDVTFMPMDDLGIDRMYPTANQNKSLAKAYGSYTYFEENDVLLAKITPCFENGKLGIATNLTNGVGFGSSEYIVLRCSEQVLPQYIYYLLNRPSFRAEGKAQMSGAVGHKRVPKDFIENLEVPLPPLAEQQRIVAKLDAAFAEIDKKTQSALEKIENAYSFERNILDAALSGVDTTKHSYTLQQLLDMGWIVSHLDGNHGSDYPRKTEFIDKGVPYISANCVIDGNVVMSKAKYLSADRAAQLRKGIARNGDVLFAHNATVGPTALLQISEEKVILGTSLTYFRCNDEAISNEYLLAFMRSRQFIKQYNDVMRQATRNQVPITKQRTFTFLIPEIDVQHKVAKTVGTLSELTAEIVRATDASKKQLNALKAAILAQELQPPQSEAA